LKVYTLYDSPIDYALTQNKLGTAYRVLADIKDTVANCEKAIQHYQEALKVYTLDDYPRIGGLLIAKKPSSTTKRL